MKILDCTLRDGGYYTNWDFEPELVKEYLTTINTLPIEYIEIGYRQPAKCDYMGEYAYLPLQTIEQCQKYAPNKKLALMLNLKDVDEGSIARLIEPIQNIIPLIRFATTPKDIEKVAKISIITRKLGIKVSANIMYMSTWLSDEQFWQQLPLLNGNIDMLCMVDSYGAVYPHEILQIITRVKKVISAPIGFHGHDNMTLAYANTLAALQAGCEIVDSTIMGMGRGAGNLRTELLMTYCAKENTQINLNGLVELIERFTPLQEKYGWGTNLPYMISGVNSLPQKDIMAMLSQKRYSIAHIVHLLQNNLRPIKSNQYPNITMASKTESILLIGGGVSVSKHIKAIVDYLVKNPQISICFLSAKHIALFDIINNPRYICLVGNEGVRVEKNAGVFHDTDFFVVSDTNSSETYIPECMKERTYVVPSNNHFDLSDAPLALAMDLVSNISTGQMILLIGMDGYSKTKHSDIFDMMHESQVIIDAYAGKYHFKSLLPTEYKHVEQSSIYAELV